MVKYFYTLNIQLAGIIDADNEKDAEDKILNETTVPDSSDILERDLNIKIATDEAL